MQRIADWLIVRVTRGAPDFIIGGAERPYIRRWWVIPRNRFFNIYLHQFLRSDDDRAHHTHPWLFNFSLLLRGHYVEHVERNGALVQTPRAAGAMKFRWAESPHRLELVNGASCWTLFVTGPRVREWGFLCAERGFVHWKDFTATDDRGGIGRGCDQ